MPPLTSSGTVRRGCLSEQPCGCEVPLSGSIRGSGAPAQRGDTPRAAMRTPSGNCGSSRRSACAMIDTAATTSPEASRTGAATENAPRVSSSTERESPTERISASLTRSSCSVVSVFGRYLVGFAASTSSSTPGSAYASSTSPTPVVCSGRREPTSEMTGTASGPESRSRYTAPSPSRTARCTCSRVDSSRSPRYGRAARAEPTRGGLAHAEAPELQAEAIETVVAAHQPAPRHPLGHEAVRRREGESRSAGDLAQRQLLATLEGVGDREELLGDGSAVAASTGHGHIVRAASPSESSSSSRSSAVRALGVSPVFTVPRGSMSSADTSPSARGQCSTPRGTT